MRALVSAIYGPHRVLSPTEASNLAAAADTQFDSGGLWIGDKRCPQPRYGDKPQELGIEANDTDTEMWISSSRTQEQHESAWRGYRIQQDMQSID